MTNATPKTTSTISVIGPSNVMIRVSTAPCRAEYTSIQPAVRL